VAHKIQIGLDVTTVKRSLFDISNTIDRTFGKGKTFDIFSADTKKFLTEEAGKALGRISSRMERLSNLAKGYQDRLKGINQEDEQAVKIKERLLKIERDRASLAEDSSELKIAQKTIAESGTIKGAARTAMSKIPGIGNLIKNGGIGMGAAALGGLALAGGFAYSRASQGFDAFEASANQRLGLRGRGVTDVSGRSGARYGFGTTETRTAQEQGIGIFGLESSQSGNASLDRRLRFSRMTGMAPETVQGTFAGTQAQGGFSAANKAFEEFRATIMADKLQHALAPYLEAVSGLLGQINEDGLGLTGDAIRSIATIAAKGENVSAQQAARIIGGIDATIKGSSGDVKAFYMQAFANKGIGGGMLGGAEAVTDLGLFGGSESAARGFQKEGLLSGRAIADFKASGLLGQNVAKERSQAIMAAMEEVRSRFPGEEALGPNASPAERQRARMQQTLARGFAMKRLTGASNVIEGEARFGAIQKMANAKTPEEYQKLAEKYEDQFGQKSMDEMMKSSEGHLKQIEANTQAAQETLGQAVAPAVLAMRELLAEIDNMLAHTLGPIAKLVEGLTPFTEGSWFTKLGKGLSNVAFDVLNPSEDSSPKGLGGRNMDTMSKAERASLISEYTADMELMKKRASEAARSGESTAPYEGRAESDKRMIELLTEANKRSEEMLKMMQIQNKYAGDTARGVNKSKAKQTPRSSTMVK
jgi:hypothetical protein